MTKPSLKSSRRRREKLASITLANVSEHITWLRVCFVIERGFCCECDVDPAYSYDDEFYDNIYLCGFLIHTHGDVQDLPLLYSAKCSGNMDLSIGFDWECLFLDSPDTLKHYAKSIERQDIYDWICDYEEDEDDDPWISARDRWRAYMRSYYNVKESP